MFKLLQKHSAGGGGVYLKSGHSVVGVHDTSAVALGASVQAPQLHATITTTAEQTCAQNLSRQLMDAVVNDERPPYLGCCGKVTSLRPCEQS